MKKIFKIFLAVLLSVTIVNAESKSIRVKYQEKSNVIKYTSTISDGTATINVGSKTVDLSVNESANGKEIILIKAEGDAYDFISSKNGEGTYYYVGILGSDDFDNTSIINTITIQDGVVNIYNANGDQIAGKIESYNVSLNSFYISLGDKEEVKEEKIYEQIMLNINGKGKVIIDGTIYEESQTVLVKKDSILIFMSDTDYSFHKLTLDLIDITYKVINNKLELDNNNFKSINVTFTEKEKPVSDKTITLYGYIKKNSLPVQNAKVLIHSNEKQVITDNDGYYEFKDVELGTHELLVTTYDDEVLGYVVFDIEDNEETMKTYRDNKQVVSIGKGFEEVNVDLAIKDEYNIDLNNVHSISVEDENKVSYYWLLLIPVILVIAAIIFKRNK